MSKFDDIRPYHDTEVRAVVDRLLLDKEFIAAVSRFRFPIASGFLLPFLRPLVAHYLKQQTKSVHSVESVQQVIEPYMRRMVEETIGHLQVSGLDNIKQNCPCLFISNHRDIAVDPALINWILHTHGHDTLRIAIGDNLLSKPYVSDLMRLNKSFIVNRSAKAPREKLKAAKILSEYIHTSIVNEGAHLWIAQREGRAKDGIDRTNSAVISMLTLNRPKTQTLADYIHQLQIIPVSISYEYDPCDDAKAKELHHHKTAGDYEKDTHEDARSIARGITQCKGDVSVHFAPALSGDYQQVDDVVQALDQQIIANYYLHPSNLVAYRHLHGELPKQLDQSSNLSQSQWLMHQQQFEQRMANIDSRWRGEAIAMYANPVSNRLTQQS